MIKKAITLVELIVAIAITFILASTAVLSFNIYDRRKLDTSARNLESDLQWAKQMAVSCGRKYILSFDLTNNSYSIYNESIAADHVIRTAYLGADVVDVTHPQVNWVSGTLVNLTLTPSVIEFNPGRGNITDSTHNPIAPINAVVIKLSRASRNVTVGISGDTGLSSYSGGGGGICFIATAAYGETDAVRSLRAWRDRYLVKSDWGRQVFDFYYFVSPALARSLAANDWARACARMLLEPLVHLARQATGDGR